MRATNPAQREAAAVAPPTTTTAFFKGLYARRDYTRNRYLRRHVCPEPAKHRADSVYNVIRCGFIIVGFGNDRDGDSLRAVLAGGVLLRGRAVGEHGDSGGHAGLGGHAGQ